jgi:hypothetical protein
VATDPLVAARLLTVVGLLADEGEDPEFRLDGDTLVLAAVEGCPAVHVTALPEGQYRVAVPSSPGLSFGVLPDAVTVYEAVMSL